MTEKQMYGMRLCVNGPGKRVPTAFSRMAWGKSVSASMIPAEMHNSMSIRRKAVRWRYWVWSKWSTLLCFTTPMVMLMSTSHTSHTEVRWSTKWPVNQRMPSGAGKRMGERLGHRSCKQPRNQNHHYFGYSQQ